MASRTLALKGRTRRVTTRVADQLHFINHLGAGPVSGGFRADPQVDEEM